MVVAPRGQTEHAVAALWTEIGLHPASIDDEFRTIGGTAAQATDLLARVLDRWDVEVTLDEFLAASSIARLSATIERKVAEARTSESDLLMGALAELERLDERFL